ncbi:hypothetical protein VB773_08535 [Haloarculaceae archaeon H-GB2-1]|nr:hypothetical protein [Haloarculaceae archaeon H-GB11]MEA5407610.1 hypothetical protein [Haloarculaceae archaeon H-GB2-1]
MDDGQEDAQAHADRDDAEGDHPQRRRGSGTTPNRTGFSSTGCAMPRTSPRKAVTTRTPT